MSARMPEYVAVQGKHLVEAYRRGIARFMEDLKVVPKSHLEPMALKVLRLMPTGEADAFLEQARRPAWMFRDVCSLTHQLWAFVVVDHDVASGSTRRAIGGRPRC